MGKRQKPRKRGGKRRSNTPRVGRKLTFLADKNLERTISDAVGRIAGYTVRTAQREHLDRSQDRGYFKTMAIELKAVVLTRDKDFAKEEDYPPGSPPGVLRIDMPRLPASEVIARLTAFLTSPDYVRCKKATVILRDRTVEIRARRGSRVVRDRLVYYEPPAEHEGA